jgi:hypothetical protein
VIGKFFFLFAVLFILIYSSLFKSYCNGLDQSIATHDLVNTLEHTTQQYGGSVFCNSMSAVFSAWSMPLLYNGSEFAAEIS